LKDRGARASPTYAAHPSKDLAIVEVEGCGR